MIDSTCTTQWMLWPNRSCQINTESPNAAAIELDAVPTITTAATRLRVISTMIMKISVSEEITAIIRSYLAPSCMSLNVAAVPPKKTFALDSDDCLSASWAAWRSESTREIPSGVAGSEAWVMKNRADLPSGDMNWRRPVWKSELSNASGGR